MQLSPTAQLSIGDDLVTIIRRGSSTPRVAAILGRERTERGETVVLDRVIHRDSDVFDDGWTASGAFVTELRRV